MDILQEKCCKIIDNPLILCVFSVLPLLDSEKNSVFEEIVIVFIDNREEIIDQKLFLDNWILSIRFHVSDFRFDTLDEDLRAALELRNRLVQLVEVYQQQISDVLLARDRYAFRSLPRTIFHFLNEKLE